MKLAGPCRRTVISSTLFVSSYKPRMGSPSSEAATNRPRLNEDNWQQCHFTTVNITTCWYRRTSHRLVYIWLHHPNLMQQRPLPESSESSIRLKSQNSKPAALNTSRLVPGLALAARSGSSMAIKDLRKVPQRAAESLEICWLFPSLWDGWRDKAARTKPQSAS